MDLRTMKSMPRHISRLRTLATVTLMVLAGCGQTPRSTPTVVTATPPTRSFESSVSAGGLPGPVEVLRNPYAGDPAIARNGATLFTSMNCDGCHAPDAGGLVGPSLIDGRWRYGGSDADLFSSIYNGRPKGMPSFGTALGANGVWTLVTYLQSLPVAADVATESWVSPASKQ